MRKASFSKIRIPMSLKWYAQIINSQNTHTNVVKVVCADQYFPKCAYQYRLSGMRRSVFPKMRIPIPFKWYAQIVIFQNAHTNAV